LKTTGVKYEGSENHGLWGFFDKNREALMDPVKETEHGRSWQYHELTGKGFDDLHKLYWVCVKDLNRALTREMERTRLRAGYGDVENEERVDVVSFPTLGFPCASGRVFS
jgi:large subunit ribosomal protein L47